MPTLAGLGGGECRRPASSGGLAELVGFSRADPRVEYGLVEFAHPGGDERDGPSLRPSWIPCPCWTTSPRSGRSRWTPPSSRTMDRSGAPGRLPLTREPTHRAGGLLGGSTEGLEAALSRVGWYGFATGTSPPAERGGPWGGGHRSPKLRCTLDRERPHREGEGLEELRGPSTGVFALAGCAGRGAALRPFSPSQIPTTSRREPTSFTTWRRSPPGDGGRRW